VLTVEAKDVERKPEVVMRLFIGRKEEMEGGFRSAFIDKLRA